MGGVLLIAAVITWGVGLMMSPHGEAVAAGTEHVRMTVVSFILKEAIGTLILCALRLAAISAAPAEVAEARLCDPWGLAVLVVSSLYNLVWLQTSVLH